MNLQDYKWMIGLFVTLWLSFLIPEVFEFDMGHGWYALPYLVTAMASLAFLSYRVAQEHRDRYIERNS